MEKKWITKQEVQTIYSIGWRVLAHLVADRNVKRRKIGNKWLYSVESIDKKVFA